MSVQSVLFFELGERRRVTLRVWVNGFPEFSLSNPTWTLKRAAAEAEGVCEAEKKDGAYLLTAEVQPKMRGDYKLQYTFEMGTEIIKKTISISVS